MKRFILKFILFSSPFLFVVLSYFVFDPFKVLYCYDNLYKDYFVSINRDYASSQLFLQNYERQHYNSFIFGSSRTMAFRTVDWTKHLDTSAHPFVFDASSERLTGIWSKIKFLDKKNIEIKNALIIVCGTPTFSKNQHTGGHLFVRHPLAAEEEFFLAFQYTFFSAYLRNYFFIRYLDYKFFRKKRDYMYKNMEFINVQVDSISNDLYRTDSDRQLMTNPAGYYREKDSVLYERSTALTYLGVQIDESKKVMLTDIKNIFDKKGTNYQIVISPLYDQKKLNPQDLKTLVTIFGREHVYDFSGVNDITKDKFNYYETSHYLPSIGKRIMDSIYSK
ncbi:MAG: hypothetical protein JWO58_88 [Chitinophagaceae bacterium]|nr:hypothetical protein [Chitinophagaceae bacterium]